VHWKTEGGYSRILALLIMIVLYTLFPYFTITIDIQLLLYSFVLLFSSLFPSLNSFCFFHWRRNFIGDKSDKYLLDLKE
jgi:hypothetical protein